jgi:hypothetical protein
VCYGKPVQSFAALLLAMASVSSAHARRLPLEQVVAMMDTARADGRAGEARKTRPVDVRPARDGEVVVTVIAGEGKETTSKPALPGDWVVRNRCPETGNEQYLVRAATFAERYSPPTGTQDRDGWREAVPRGKTLRFFVLSPEQGELTFEAPWGETMVAKPGDAIVQDPGKPGDTYRVAAASFSCTYEVVK